MPTKSRKSARRTSMRLTESAKTVLEARYLRKDPSGRVVESADEMIDRVATAVARAEAPRGRARWQNAFADIMRAGRFLPNSPTLMNAGREGGQLSACFVLPVEDSLESIFDTLKQAALIHQSGGGTGFGFSRLRPRGSEVRTTQGVASGPVSFLRIYDAATDAIKQGGTRRGANMGVLRVDHPDIGEFVDAKRDLNSFTNFNLSVGITNEFMGALALGGDFALRDPGTGRERGRLSARELWDRIAEGAWLGGDPGLVYLDRINLFNPTPALGAMESTNPCGEQPLLGYESCNLGSLNLSRYRAGMSIDWAGLGEDVALGVRFLDNVIDVNAFPLKECARITLRNRKIGLGVMGFADLLLELRIPYDSGDALILGEQIMAFIDRAAKAASVRLAQERGAFANFRGSLWNRLGFPPMRNATVTTVAPTGTISIIAGCSSGIEPIFSAVLVRNVLSGARLEEIHPAVLRELSRMGKIPELGASWSDDDLRGRLGPVWTPARAVSTETHVRMQSVFQRHSDSAVSKTVNLPESASPKDIQAAYLLAYRLGCKGITVYRDRSRAHQVLESGASALSPAESKVCPEC